MTQKEFKLSLQRGRGQALQAARDCPQKYRRLVLWACGRNLAFDAQCEGTRSWYVYQMISCFTDKTAFVQAAADGLARAKARDDWRVLYLSELLFLLWKGGESSALDAVWKKYEVIYNELLNMACSLKRRLCAKDTFEMLCLVLAYDERMAVKIADDIGKLYQNITASRKLDFSWLYSANMKQYQKALRKSAKKSKNVETYLLVSAAEECRWTQTHDAPPQKPKAGRALSVYLKYRADAETIRRYAKQYEAEKDLKVRADALRAFCCCPYPDDPRPILADAMSSCEELKHAAWEALGSIRHPLVREFALNHPETDQENALGILIRNYLPRDAQRLEKIVRELSVDQADKTGWHGVYLAVLAMSEDGATAPAQVLRQIYQASLCACCREYALRQMVKRRIAENDILEECLLDCNENTRRYAAQVLRRRERNSHGAEGRSKA